MMLLLAATIIAAPTATFARYSAGAVAPQVTSRDIAAAAALVNAMDGETAVASSQAPTRNWFGRKWDGARNWYNNGGIGNARRSLWSGMKRHKGKIGAGVAAAILAHILAGEYGPDGDRAKPAYHPSRWAAANKGLYNYARPQLGIEGARWADASWGLGRDLRALPGRVASRAGNAAKYVADRTHRSFRSKAKTPTPVPSDDDDEEEKTAV